jgi:hypothetical protein
MAHALEAGPASANGLELLPGGARSAGRAGAVAARPEDPMALAHNPAGMAFMADDQFMVNVELSVHDMCVDLYGFYGWGVYEDGGSEFGDQLDVDSPDAYATTPLPEICNSAPALPLPHIAAVLQVTDALAIGFGMIAPTIVTGLQYGGEDGTIDTPDGGLPSPTRYQFVRQTVDFGLAPTFGAAYRVMPQLSVGATLQVAMLRATTRIVQNATSGTQPSHDWLVDVTASDYFLPAITVGVHAKPIPAVDLMANLRWVDGFDGSGEVVYETNTFHRNATSGPAPLKNDPVDLSVVQVGLPWTLTLGVRYAGLLPGAEPQAGRPEIDPMERELWDVELDFAYNLNSLGSESAVAAGEDVTILTREVGGGGDRQTVDLDDLSQLSVDRHLKDSAAVRLGGSYSVLPRKLAVHAGSFFETRGLDPAYASIDSFAFQRVGIGLGVMGRLGSFDLIASYAHIFQETVEVAPPPHQNVEDADPNDPTSGFDQRVGGTFGPDGERVGGFVLEDPDAPDPDDADAVARQAATSAAPSPSRPDRVINAGKYTAAFDVISVGMTYHW